MIVLGLPLLGNALSFCRVEVENPFSLERGFINSYLTRKVFDTLIETGFVQNCTTGKTVEVVVKEVSYRGSTISQNRFSGYTFYIDFSIILPGRTFNYHLSRYVALPDPSKGTLPIRGVLIDLLDSYQLAIKRDLLNYLKWRKEQISPKGEREN